MKFILTCLLLMPWPLLAATTNLALAFSITNWNGAGDSSRVFLSAAGDSITAGYREPPGSVVITTTAFLSQLSGVGFLETNTAVPGEFLNEFYPRATNVMGTRRPNIVIIGSPANDCIHYVNTPTQMWLDFVSTNDLLLASARLYGCRLLYLEFIPRSTDYFSVITNWNAKLADWAGTNSDVVTLGRVWDAMKSPTNNAFMIETYTSDNLHVTALGHTNFCQLIYTNLIACVSKTSATPSYLNFTNILQTTKNGDTINIPAGSNNWSTTATITNALRIVGAGITSTILAFGADTPLFNFKTASTVNRVFRLNDLQIAAGPSPSSSAWFYVEGCNTNNTYMVCENLEFKGTTSPCPFVIGAIGVMINCQWEITNSIGCYVYHENWGGKLYSAGSFSEAVQYGTDKFWIIESSRISRAGASYAFTDAYRGARYVMRNTFLTNNWLEAHGTESGFVRGTRAVESYRNYFYGDGLQNYGHNMRSATLVAWSNGIVNAGGAANFAHLDAYRKTVLATPWGGATGDNPIDTNFATIYDSGTATSGGTRTLTDTGKTWTPNQWVGYTLSRMTPLAASTTILTDFRHGYVTSNTATTISVSENIGGAFADIVYAANDTYRIYRVNQIFDQPGAGLDNSEITYRKNSALSVSANTATATYTMHGLTTGDYIVIGDLFISPDMIYTMAQVTVSDANTYTFTLYHANGSGSSNFEGYWYKIPQPYAQTLDPCYAWNNVREGGTPVNFSVNASNIIRSNEHYYDSTSKPGYTPLAYPHRLSESGFTQTPGFNIPADMTNIPRLSISGGVSISGKVTTQ